MRCVKRSSILILFPLLLGGWLTGLPFRPPFPYLNDGLGATPAPVHLAQKHRGAPLPSDNLTGTIFIYSFQPWGGAMNKSDRPASHMERLGTIRVLSRDHLQSMSGKAAFSDESKNRTKSAHIRPSVQFFRLRNPNWLITS